MADTMLAAVLHAPRDMRVEAWPVPRLRSDYDALVRVQAVGICGSDMHFYTDGRIGSFVVEEPLILGHEAAGTVEAVGDRVTRLRPGDRVAIEPGYPCRRCEFCKSGRYNLCPDVVFMAAPPTHGAFCEYVVWPEDFLFPLPEQVSLEEGAMLEPLAVGMWAARRAGIRPGDSAVVLGAGPIGLVTLQAARLHGAYPVYVTDMVDSRLAFARRLGATEVINTAEADPVQAVRELTEGRGVDVALECAGAAPTVAQAIAMVRRGGMVQVVGNMPDTLDHFPLLEAVLKELTISGLFRYVNCYPPSLAAVASGAVDVKSLITHRFPLAETPEAFEYVLAHRHEVIKAVVTP